MNNLQKHISGLSKKFDEFSNNEDNHEICYECDGKLLVSEIKSHLLQSHLHTLELLKEEVKGKKYEDNNLGTANIKPTEMFERGYNSAIAQVSILIDDLIANLKKQ